MSWWGLDNWLVILIVRLLYQFNIEWWSFIDCLLLYFLFDILWTWHECLLTWNSSTSREDWSNYLAIKTCSLIKCLLILICSTWGPIIFILHSLLTLNSLFSSVNIVTLFYTLNIADVNSIHSLDFIELVNLLYLTIDEARRIIKSRLPYQASISESLIISKMNLDDTGRWVQGSHDSCIRDSWFENTSLLVESNELMNPSDLFIWLWRYLLESWVLFLQLWGSFHALGLWRHEWLIEGLFLMLGHFHRWSSLVVYWLILGLSWVVLRCRNKALLATIEVWVLSSVVLRLLSLSVDAWLIHSWWSLVPQFVSKWTCILLVVLIKDLRKAHNLSLILLSIWSLVLSGLWFSFGGLWPWTLFALKTLRFQFSFLNIFI